MVLACRCEVQMAIKDFEETQTEFIKQESDALLAEVGKQAWVVGRENINWRYFVMVCYGMLCCFVLFCLVWDSSVV